MLSNKKRSLLRLASLFALSSCLFITTANAGVGEIVGPHVHKESLEFVSVNLFEFDYDDSDQLLENELEVKYGLTDRILLEAVLTTYCRA